MFACGGNAAEQPHEEIFWEESAKKLKGSRTQIYLHLAKKAVQTSPWPMRLLDSIGDQPEILNTIKFSLK